VAEQRANVLLVDDRRANLVALQAILEPLGQNLVLADSGLDALRRLMHDEFAVILLDVQMPGLDGFETAELIKQRERTRSIPIIFLTAISKEEQHVFRGYEVGAVDYVFKPFDPGILRSKVNAFIELWRMRKALQEQERDLRERELAAVRAEELIRYRALADAMPQLVWTTDAKGRVDYVNKGWIDYTGISLEELQGDGQVGVVHTDDLPSTIERWHSALQTGRPYEVEYRLRRASDGAYRWQLARALPGVDEKGNVTGWVGTCTDIDDQKRAGERQRFLLDAGRVLGSSLDYRRTLADVARLAVPDIADWCQVDIVDNEGSIKQLALAHADPAKLAFAEELTSRYPSDTSAPQGPAAVIRSGKPELVRTITAEQVEAAAVDELHLDLLRELALRSYMCVPLVARGRTLGAITFVGAESGRLYDENDLVVAEELAQRASTAIDNAQLYREAEERGEAARVLATVGDGVFLVDDEGTIRLWNPAAEAITGLRGEEMLGKRAEDVLPGWSSIAARIPIASSPGPPDGRAETVPLELGGRERWLSISGVGFDEGIVYAFRDLTEERALESMRQEFVATVSHELRTPLAAIYGSALTIRRDDIDLDDEMRSQLLGVIAEESDRLGEIVNDLLLASHLDSGRLEAATESCDGAELANSVVHAARAHAGETIAIELDAGRDLPPVLADPGQLQQVLSNLVDNAIKYSPDGGTINVRLEAQNGHLRFEVRDEGLGIPPNEQQRIFEKFYRLDPDMTRGIGGTGLGLYICRELVRRVGGRIWVESAEGRGSTFSVEIPLAGAAEKSRPQRRKKTATR
jgi:PAS domain S-box-containing protein